MISAYQTAPLPEFTPRPRPRLLIVCNDVIDVKMAGPGMRYLEMARALADDLEVTLAVPLQTSLEVRDLQIQPFQWENPKSLEHLVEKNEIVLISSMILK